MPDKRVIRWLRDMNDDEFVESMFNVIGAAVPEDVRERLLALARKGLAKPAASVERSAVLEEAAKVCENVCFGADVEWWLNATKKEVSAKSCHECAKAIRELAAASPALSECVVEVAAQLRGLWDKYWDEGLTDDEVQAILEKAAAMIEGHSAPLSECVVELLKPIYDARVGLAAKAQKGYYICEGYDLTYAELLKVADAYTAIAAASGDEPKS